MNIQNIKLELVEQILKTNNLLLLNQLLNLFKTEKSDFWDTLSESDRQQIIEGLSQLDNGEGTSSDIVMKNMRK